MQALNDVDLDVPAGHITALVGDNGAGKSTLIKTIAGIWHRRAARSCGTGARGDPHPEEADNLGIATVYQDLALCDNLDIVQNMFLGHEELPTASSTRPAMELTAKQTLADLSVTTVQSVRQLVGSLSGGQRQSVAVARAVMRDAKLVIMDEPTAALGVSQTAQVLDLIKTLGERGIAVIVISHNLNDVFEVADRIAVLYLGRMVSSGPIAEYDTAAVGRADHDRDVQVTTTPAADSPERGSDRCHSTRRRSGPGGDVPPGRHPGETTAEGTMDDTGGCGLRLPALSGSLGDYTRATLKRIRSGESGVLPVLGGLILLVIIFQAKDSVFLSAGNLVNLLVQGSVFVVLGMAEIWVLVLGEIDLRSAT